MAEKDGFPPLVGRSCPRRRLKNKEPGSAHVLVRRAVNPSEGKPPFQTPSLVFLNQPLKLCVSVANLLTHIQRFTHGRITADAPDL